MQMRTMLSVASLALLIVAGSASADQKVKTKSNIKNDRVACTENCTDAGYEWAEKNKPTDASACEDASAEFTAGCAHFLQDQADITAAAAADAAGEAAVAAGSAEQAADVAENVADNASGAAEQAADKAADSAEKAADVADDAADEAKDAADSAADDANDAAKDADEADKAAVKPASGN